MVAVESVVVETAVEESAVEQALASEVLEVPADVAHLVWVVYP